MSDERWADARRLESWAGEARVNLIRAAALLVFYGHVVAISIDMRTPGFRHILMLTYLLPSLSLLQETAGKQGVFLCYSACLLFRSWTIR